MSECVHKCSRGLCVCFGACLGDPCASIARICVRARVFVHVLHVCMFVCFVFFVCGHVSVVVCGMCVVLVRGSCMYVIHRCACAGEWMFVFETFAYVGLCVSVSVFLACVYVYGSVCGVCWCLCHVSPWSACVCMRICLCVFLCVVF